MLIILTINFFVFMLLADAFIPNDLHFIESLHFIMHCHGNEFYDLVNASTMIDFLRYRNAFVTAKYKRNRLK